MTRRTQVLIASFLCIALVACAGCRSNAGSDAGQPESAATTQTGAYTQKDVPVFREELTKETISLRFYKETPNVAYVNVADFYALMLPKGSMDITAQDDGTYLLTSHTGANPSTNTGEGLGGTAVVDPAAGTLTSPNLPAFTNLMSLCQEGLDNVYYDASPYVRVAQVEYDKEPQPITLDFARYGIAIHADDEGVYLPFQTTSAIFSDLANHYASYNGEKVYVNDPLSYGPPAERDSDFSNPIIASRTRPDDLAAFSYAHIRFIFDNFYGMPSRKIDVLGDRDLDATLEGMGESGKAIKKGLASTDLVEYVTATRALDGVVNDGGHTDCSTWLVGILEKDEGLSEAMNELSEDTSNPLGAYLSTLDGEGSYMMELGMRTEQRQEAYGDETYVKKGDTAVIVFNSFTVNNAAWNDYYAGKGEKPSASDEITDGFYVGEYDTAAIVAEGLEKAAADPEVKNVVFDLSCNSGGSLDVCEFIESLVSGKNTSTYQNVRTDQLCTEYWDVDRNLDGVFDEKDDSVNYSDLRFAVLTSKMSFSCGNLFPSKLHDDGILIIGEQSGGGGCAVEMSVTAEGVDWQLSSWLGRIVNAAGEEIDSGVPVDVDLLERAPSTDEYSCFYDIDLLSEIMNEHYGETALPEAA